MKHGHAGGCLSVVAEGTLTEKQITQVQQMREEQKLARDVYLALAEQWETSGLRIAGSTRNNSTPFVLYEVRAWTQD